MRLKLKNCPLCKQQPQLREWMIHDHQDNHTSTSYWAEYFCCNFQLKGKYAWDYKKEDAKQYAAYAWDQLIETLEMANK